MKNYTQKGSNFSSSQKALTFQILEMSLFTKKSYSCFLC